MMGIAQPLQRRKEDVAAHTLLGAPDDFTEQQTIGMQRHVMAVLFMGSHGKHHRRVHRQRLHLRPFHFGELHGERSLSDQAGCHLAALGAG